MTIQLSTATQNGMADVVTTQADSGAGAATLTVYGGTQPADANTATAETALVSFTLNGPSFTAAASGAISPAGTPIAATASAAGTATWFRLESSTPSTVLDGSVTADGGGGDMTIDNVSIASGQTVNLTGGNITHLAS